MRPQGTRVSTKPGTHYPNSPHPGNVGQQQGGQQAPPDDAGWSALKFMLKKYAMLLSPDGNTGGESSTSSDGKQGAESSTASQDGNNATEGEEQESESTEENAEESSEQSTGEEEAGDQLNNQQEVEGEQETTEADKKEKFIPRERFDEVNTKYVTAEQKAKATKSLSCSRLRA